MFAGLGSDAALAASPAGIPADSEAEELTLSSSGSKEHQGLSQLLQCHVKVLMWPPILRMSDLS